MLGFTYFVVKWLRQLLLEVQQCHIIYMQICFSFKEKKKKIQDQTKKVNLELPYNTDELVKGFVHIHWRILGTGFNIGYLRKQTFG